jgi:hypothetical protein
MFSDTDPFAINSNGNIYYRLKIYDKDGKYTYSNILTINPLTGSTKFRLFPNPVIGSTMYINIGENRIDKAEIKIEDVSGRLYSKYSVTSNNNGRNIPIRVDKLSAGVYMLKVETSNKTYVQRFVVQH